MSRVVLSLILFFISLHALSFDEFFSQKDKDKGVTLNLYIDTTENTIFVMPRVPPAYWIGTPSLKEIKKRSYTKVNQHYLEKTKNIDFPALFSQSVTRVVDKADWITVNNKWERSEETPEVREFKNKRFKGVSHLNLRARFFMTRDHNLLYVVWAGEYFPNPKSTKTKSFFISYQSPQRIIYNKKISEEEKTLEIGNLEKEYYELVKKNPEKEYKLKPEYQKKIKKIKSMEYMEVEKTSVRFEWTEENIEKYINEGMQTVEEQFHRMLNVELTKKEFKNKNKMMNITYANTYALRRHKYAKAENIGDYSVIVNHLNGYMIFPENELPKMDFYQYGPLVIYY
ncbi:hypothetical protein [Teredinibacter sp. KSP-S5-2]|uniref:hypothetical protein n=1 Tax=Teredinibacter sp. KSP-S5-2 TaxID=3034506 RepID=UPI00293438BD|nr:hypothetical protein [Teredinibacter sp. KSP-S5-2]WNO09123.1 hypothetical protein P5V12_19450 [Teredinibacter sp. KSP-S5-2]